MKERTKSKVFKVLALSCVLAMSGAVFTGCGSQKQEKSEAVKGSLTASGSSALQPLAQQAADDFTAENPDASITINGGGSGTGLQQVSDGSVDIGNSDVYAEEKLDADQAKALKDHKVATITVAAVVNKDLGVKDLTTDQLTKIFTGQITNWKDVGGPDEQIMLVTRPASSGTRALFKQYAIGGQEEASNSALETDDSGTLMETVKKNKGAIGYVALSYLVNEKEVTGVAIDGVKPTLKNTYSGKYNVWGYEHMYTKGEPNKISKAFINYLTSDDYARNVEKLGYGAISKMSDKAVKNHEK